MKAINTTRFAYTFLIAAAITLAGSNLTLAQSGQKSGSGAKAKTGSGAKSHSGSGAKTTAGSGSAAKSSGSGSKSESKLALEGYCPVCVVVGKGWVKGNPSIQSTFDGKTYYFPSADVKKTFDAEPVKYTPALSGDCVVCLKKKGERVAGKINYSSLAGKRLFLFPDEDTKRTFDTSPADYINVDLAAEGNCTVCLVDHQETVAGSKDFVTMHNGMRYQFPEQAQLDAFLANPKKYAVGGSATK